MKECPSCRHCFKDEFNNCPTDGNLLRLSIRGDTVLDGRYQLERRLGEGGMGIVFKARHIFLKTPCAIKVILPDLVGNDPMLVTRFRQEAMVAARIRHRNIVNVTDFGVVRETMPYLVMDFVKGRSLHEFLLEKGPLPQEQALEIMEAVCAGVGAAHQQGIIHRDLKPLNIMLQEGVSVGEAVKVLDFGLAKIKSSELLGSFVAAQTTGLMGSPLYMAPEQWSDEEPDAHADVYSLGVILFQMIAGDVPFKGSSIPSIMKKHLTDPPPSFTTMGVDVPPAIEAVVRRALAKRIEDRLPSVGAFISEFRAAVTNESSARAHTQNTQGSGAETVPYLDTDPTRLDRTVSSSSLEETTWDRLTLTDSQRRIEDEADRLAREFEEAQRRADEARGRAEEAARRRAEEEAARKRAEEEAARKLAEEEAARKLAEEAELKLAEEEASRKLAEEEAARKRAAEEARQLAEEEAARQRVAEEANRLAREVAVAQQRAEEARLRAEEESRKRTEEEVARKRAEDEARRLAQEVAEAQRRVEEARLRAEAESRKRAEEERARSEAEEVAARKRAEEAARIQIAEETARKRAAEEADRLGREVAEAKRRAEEARIRAEEEAQRRAEEEEARKRAEEEARRLAQEVAEAQRRVEEARRRAEEEARKHPAAADPSRTAPLLPEAQIAPASLSPAAAQNQSGFSQSLGDGSLPQQPGLLLRSQPKAEVSSQEGQPRGRFSFSLASPWLKIAVSFVFVAAFATAMFGVFVFRSSKTPLVAPQSANQSNTGGTVKAGGPADTRTASAKADLIKVEGGAFQMGRSDIDLSTKNVYDLTQWPAHNVTVKSFFMDKTEVTNAEYAEFVAATNYLPPGYWVNGKPPAGQEQWPVTNVSLDDAEAFARWRSRRDAVKYRLPTEEEWEYAARNGSEATLYPWGNQWLDDRANVGTNSLKPVGSYPLGASRQGVLDLIGNVWEWTSTKAALYPGNTKVNLPQGQIIRGGAYLEPSRGPEAITATRRSVLPPSDKTQPSIGFRLVRDVP